MERLPRLTKTEVLTELHTLNPAQHIVYAGITLNVMSTVKVKQLTGRKVFIERVCVAV